MTVLDRIVIARAEAQLARWNYRAEPVTHDRWQIRGDWTKDRVPRPPKRPCFAGGCASRVIGHGYCRLHLERIRRGFPYDSDLYEAA